MANQLNQEADFFSEDAASNHRVGSGSAATHVQLIAEADQLWSDMVAMQESQPQHWADCTKRLIGTIFDLQRAISPHQDLYRAFLDERGVVSSKSQNPYHATARAVMERNGAKKARSLCTHYAQACSVLSEAGVEPGAAVQWLNEPLDTGSGGRPLTGLGKTKHLWSLTLEGARHRKKKSSTKVSQAKRILDNIVESREGQIDDAMIAVDRTGINEGVRAVALIEIIDGAPRLLNVLTTDLIKTAATVRACQRAARDEACRVT